MTTYDEKFIQSALVMLEGAGYPGRSTALREVADHLKVQPSTLKRWYGRTMILPDATVFPVEMIDPAILKPHPRNYKEHPDDQLDHIAQSIRDHGFYRNIVIAQEDTILAGHGVVKASLRMRLSKVPVYRLPIAPDDPRALKVMISDNEIEHMAERDDRALSELLKSIKENSPDDALLGTGYDDKMLANLIYVTRPREEIQTFDAAAHWVGMPEYDNPTEPYKLVVSFRSEADRDQFMRESKITRLNGRNGNTWSTWWPEKQRDDLSSVRFEVGEGV